MDNYSSSFQKIDLPIRCINSDMNPTNVESAQKYATSFDVKLMSKVGHFVMLEDPITFNNLLKKTIEEITNIP